MEPSPEEAERRRQWFEWYVDRTNRNSVHRSAVDGPHRCPCCHCRTIDERGMYDICPVCFWEDDGQDDHDAATVRGGPNGSLSLIEARANYLTLGACEAAMLGNVRPPTPEERPDAGSA